MCKTAGNLEWAIFVENQIEAVFRALDVSFETQAMTENKNKPDFLFPNLASYADSDFPAERLTMLGAKSSCKERWRQILSEADRIEQKHLITLEPGIFDAQTSQMKVSQVQLVVPSSIQSSYNKNKISWLFCFSDFIQMVDERSS